MKDSVTYTDENGGYLNGTARLWTSSYWKRYHLIAAIKQKDHGKTDAPNGKAWTKAKNVHLIDYLTHDIEPDWSDLGVSRATGIPTTNNNNTRSSSNVRSNKYPGKCYVCGEKVEAGEGLAFKPSPSSKWSVKHSEGKCPASPATKPDPYSEPSIANPTQYDPAPTGLDEEEQALLEAFRNSRKGLDRQEAIDLINETLADRIDQVTAKAETLIAEKVEAINGPLTVTRAHTPEPPTIVLPAGTYHRQTEEVLRALEVRRPDGTRPLLWLAGPAGTGKSSLFRTVCTALGNTPYIQPGSGGLLETDILGHGGVQPPEPSKFNPDHVPTLRSQLRLSVEDETGAYALDEGDKVLPETIATLQAGFESRRFLFPDGEKSTPIDWFGMILANTWGLGPDAQYVGSAQQDVALINRFDRIDIDYDRDLERAISDSIAGEEQGRIVRDRIEYARKRAAELRVEVIISTRDVERIAAYVNAGYTLDQACGIRYEKGLSDDVLAALRP